MKKILLALGVVVLIAVVAMATNEANSPSEEPATSSSTVSEDMIEENILVDGKTGQVVNDEVLAEGEQQYIVQSGTVSYTVNKQWLKKDQEDVIGTTADVSGVAIYNSEQQSLTTLSATVDSQSFDSGNKTRDGEVAELLGKKITVVAKESINGVDDDFSEQIEMDVTINDVTKTIQFDVTGQRMENGEMSLQGTSTLSLEAFEIEAPSALGVYGVADDVDLKFSVVAK